MSSPPLAPEDRHDTALARILHREGVLPLDTIQGALGKVRERRSSAPGVTLAGTLLASGVLSGDQLDRAHALLRAEGFLRPLPAPPAPEAGGFGPYQVQREVARGGMGVVYEVIHSGSGERYALKTLLAGAGDDPDEFARFRREAAAMGQLDHANVARVFAADVFGRTPYLVQELLTGGTLHERALRRPLASGEAARLVLALAEGLAHSHAAGILHRDLKPENVLFDGEGVPKLVDFGLAFSAEASQRLTASGALLGTPAYMAPEQALGLRDFDVRVDVYGLGGVLYFLLCGRAPFAGGLFEVLEQVVSRAPERPSAINPEVTRGLEAICLRALSKEPGERFADMASFAAALAEEARDPGLAPARGKVALALGGVGLGLLALTVSAALASRGPSQGGRPSATVVDLFPGQVSGPSSSPGGSEGPAATPGSRSGLGQLVNSWSPGGGALSAEGFDLAVIQTQVVTLERAGSDLSRRGAAERHSLRAGVVRLWSLEDGRGLGRLDLEGLRPLKLERSRDQTLIAVACERAVAVYDTKTWARLRLLERSQPGRVRSLAFSPQGKTLALGAGDKRADDFVRLWDWESSAPQKLPLKGGVLAFVDEATLALSTQDERGVESLVFWSLPGERALQRTELPKGTGVMDMDVSPDGRLLFVGSWNKTVSAWDVQARRLRKRIEVGVQVTRVQLDRLGRTLLVATGLRSLIQVDPLSLEHRVLGPAPGRSARDAVPLAGGKIVVAGTDHRLRLLDRALRPLWKSSRAGPLRTLASSEQGVLLANDQRLSFLEPSRGELALLGPLVRYAPGRLRVVHASRRWDRVWSVHGAMCRLAAIEGARVKQLGARIAPGAVYALAAAEGRSDAFAVASDGLKGAWVRPARISKSSGSASLLWEWFERPPSWGKREGWSRASAPVAHVTSAGRGVTGDWSGSLQAWDLEGLKEVDSRGPGEVPSPIVSLASDQGVVYAGTRDGRIRRWRPGVAEEKFRPLRGHEGPVFALCVLPGHRLASVGEDGGLVIWDLERGWLVERRTISVGVPHLLSYREGVLWVATTSGHVQAYSFR